MWKAWAGLALVLTVGVAGCQSQRTEPSPAASSGGGGGITPTIAPSPLKAPPNPQLESGRTGGVGQRSGGDMGGMDSSGIGPGSASGGGGGNPQGGPTAGTNSIVAPPNDPALIKQ